MRKGMVKDELYYSLAWRVLPPWVPAFSAVAMTTGTDLLYLAETCLDEERVNVLVPKNNPHWLGPWSRARLAFWAVYQQQHARYGCHNNYGNPALADA